MAEENLPESERKEWVQFDEEGASNGAASAAAPATIDVHHETYNTPVTAGAVGNKVQNGDRSVADTSLRSAALQDVSLADQTDLRHPATGTSSNTTGTGRIRTGFENGDVIVSLLPLNTKFPWITPAQFRPELVPEELMAEGLTLTVEEYVQAMELLVNDVRFNAYNICYKRILVGWIAVGFIVLLAILFGTRPGLQLFGAGVVWLIINAVAIFFCMYVKIKLNRELERCVALVNRIFIKHNILLGVDDRGRLSCHKVNLCFIFFKSQECVKRLQEVVDRNPAVAGGTDSDATAVERARRMEQRMDIDDSDIIITGSQNTRLSRKHERAERLLLRYSQRWAKDLLRKRLDWTVDLGERLEGGLGGRATPRHLTTARCPCQYVEDHLSWKPQRSAGNDTCCGLPLPEPCATLFC